MLMPLEIIGHYYMMQVNIPFDICLQILECCYYKSTGRFYWLNGSLCTLYESKVTPSHLAKFVMRVTVMSHSFLTVVCKLVSVRNHSHVAKWQQKIFLPTMAYSGQTRNSNGNKFLANIQKTSYISDLICPNETPPFPQPITGKW